MSTAAIDLQSSRSTERLTVFLSEINAGDPVDNRFVERPVLEALMKNKKTVDGSRQKMIVIDQGENNTVKDFSDYDTFDLVDQDTAMPLIYSMVNKGGALVVSWEQEREVAGSDHATFDLIKHKRNNLLNTIMDKYASDLFASSQVASKITTLVTGIDSTGSVGNLSQSTSADWASTETASGSFASQGLADMRTTYRTIVQNGAVPDLVVSTVTEHGYYEKKIDPDVRYVFSGDAIKTGGRGFPTLSFMGMPWIYDAKATAGVIYLITTKNCYFLMDSAAPFGTFDPFMLANNQKAKSSLCYGRGNLIIDRRKSHGKLTGVTA